MKNVIKIGLMIGLVFSLTSCATWFSGSSKARKIDFHMVASSNINRNIINQPSPIAITIYQLDQNSNFFSADYQTLQGNQLLGVLGKETLMIWPGKTLNRKLELAPGTKAVGIVADYRQLDQKQWKLTQQLGWLQSKISLKIKANGISE